MNRLVYAAFGIMILWTGRHFAGYLERWEFIRALVAGELLLLALLALIGFVLVNHLSRLETRITELAERVAPAPPTPQKPAIPANTASEPTLATRPRFRWLAEDNSGTRYGVFIPVLLGAGVLVTAIAALVERLAARWTRGRASSPSRVRAAPELPSGGVLAGSTGLPAPQPRRHPVRTFAVIAVLTGAGIAAGMLGTDLLADRTQDRPDPPAARGSTTTVVLTTTFNAGRVPEESTRRLWEFCRGSTYPYQRHGGMLRLDATRFALVVTPALGEHAMRRFEGCLRDAIVDHSRFDIQSIEHRKPG